MKKHIIWLLLFLPMYSFAESFYVDDTLRVGIRPAAGKGGPSIAVVTTGTKLELLERRGAYAKVRSPNGVEGWVRSAYLSRKKPASLLLSEAKGNISKLEKEIRKLRNQGKGNLTRDPALQDTIKRLEAEKESLTSQMQQLKSEVESQPARSQSTQWVDTFARMDATPLYIALGVLIFILSLGFLFGVTWHKHQVTKRLGGLSL